MARSFRAPRGTFDLVPPRSEVVLAVRDALARPARLAGYGYVETPAFEETALFARGVGESTDIVSKEMYSFTTRGGDNLTLRPEGTAPVVRAALQHGLQQGVLPVKLWYSGSFYRYERPQAGRYRHFSQVGAEALGSDDPLVDAELIAIGCAGYRELGLTQFRLLLNSLGCRTCRPAYREALQSFLRGLDLDEDTLRRVEVNPLRVLDDKRAEVQRQLADAPLMVDFLCAECRDHEAAVQDALRDLGVGWEDDRRLVRGLDYYTRTTFEFVHEGLGAQSAIGGGGRYDGLAEDLGGQPLSGVGWALGVDRTLLALEAEGVGVPVPPACQVFGVALGEQARRRVLVLVDQLRRAGIAADMAFDGPDGRRGLKGAMKAADRSGARYALIVGDRDLESGEWQVRDLSSGEQDGVRAEDLVRALQERLDETVTQ